jgi:hypothetical protein
VLTWDKKKDIYAVVRALIGTSGVTITDTMWGRWAWIVSPRFHYCNDMDRLNTSYPQQIKLVDFQEAVKKNEKREKQFWDWIDESLEKRRTQFKHLPMPDRSAEISR